MIIEDNQLEPTWPLACITLPANQGNLMTTFSSDSAITKQHYHGHNFISNAQEHYQIILKIGKDTRLMLIPGAHPLLTGDHVLLIQILHAAFGLRNGLLWSYKQKHAWLLRTLHSSLLVPKLFPLAVLQCVLG